MKYAQLEAGLARVLELIAMAMMMALVGVITYAVLGRQVFHLPVAWSEEVGAGLMAWMVLLGSASAWYHQRHLVIDVLLRRLNRHWLRGFCIIIEMCGLILLSVAFWGSQSMMRVSAHNSTTALGISYSYLYLALVIGLGAMILFSVAQLVRLIRGDDAALPRYDAEGEWNT
ncbi:MAG: TRAP transporter small permease [Rhodobacteraceae bacterium]|nr:TRAP transporter small permease [Paracoccaceae bacterium]